MNDFNRADIIMDAGPTQRMNIMQLKAKAIDEIVINFNNKLLKKPMDGLVTFRCLIKHNGKFELVAIHKSSFKVNNRWKAYSTFFYEQFRQVKKQIKEILEQGN